MKIPFTPAVERVLAGAATWSCRNTLSAIEPAEVLMALVAEPECRAAELLGKHGIDETAILLRWPQLTVRADWAALRAGDHAPSLRSALHEARSWLAERGERELATEHLLWGILQSNPEFAAWLSSRGLITASVLPEFTANAETPLPLDMDDEAATIPAAVADSADSHTEHSAMNSGVWRALDAAGNRAREGLRVVEDYVRFVLDDRHLTERVKALRHDLSAALETLSTRERFAARDTTGDVGTSVTVPSEGARANAASVAIASLKRTGEALRSLEEYGKVIDAAFAARVESLRYRLYTLEKAVSVTVGSLEKLASTRLYVLLDGRESLAAFQAAARQLVEAGVDIIQLRDKHLADRELLDRARALRMLTRDTKTLFIMNDRPDLATLAEADGVHVGQDELSVLDVRRIIGAKLLVGVSTHSLAQAEQAVLDGADYIGCGPTFPSTTKSFAEFPGLEFLRQVASTIRLPAFAIGGITLENLTAVRATGIERVAVSSAIANADDRSAAAASFKKRLAT